MNTIGQTGRDVTSWIYN